MPDASTHNDDATFHISRTVGSSLGAVEQLDAYLAQRSGS